MLNKLALPILVLIPVALFIYYITGWSKESWRNESSSGQASLSQPSELAAPPLVASPEAQARTVEPEQPEDLVVVASPSASSFPADKISLIVVKEGSGSARAKREDKLTVHYTGLLLSGVKFDSSVDRGEPFIFTLGQGQVIRGWDLGLVGMKVGEVRRLIIPPFLAYGGKAVGPIPANSPLFFEIQLLKVN